VGRGSLGEVHGIQESLVGALAWGAGGDGEPAILVERGEGSAPSAILGGVRGRAFEGAHRMRGIAQEGDTSPLRAPEGSGGEAGAVVHRPSIAVRILAHHALFGAWEGPARHAVKGGLGDHLGPRWEG
jgi:hypothetical protein